MSERLKMSKMRGNERELTLNTVAGKEKVRFYCIQSKK